MPHKPQLKERLYQAVCSQASIDLVPDIVLAQTTHAHNHSLKRANIYASALNLKHENKNMRF